MSLFIWNQPLYSVEIKEFDEHHKKMIETINNLHDSMLQGTSKEIMGEVLKDLKKYTIYHFDAEEKKMVKYGYPEYEKHKSEHNIFKNKIKELLTKHKEEHKSITIETFRFLKDWLVNHIQKSDKRYIPYFQQFGIE